MLLNEQYITEGEVFKVCARTSRYSQKDVSIMLAGTAGRAAG